MRKVERLPRAMVLVYMDDLRCSVWQDFVSQHRTSKGLESRLRKGVKDGEWVAWRLMHVIQEVMGNAD
jgi:hypothetical protein